MGPGRKVLTQSDHFFVVGVGLGQPVWKISPKNSKFFKNFPLWVNIGSSKKIPESKMGQPLIYRRSKVYLGHGSSLEWMAFTYRYFWGHL